MRPEIPDRLLQRVVPRADLSTAKRLRSGATRRSARTGQCCECAGSGTQRNRGRLGPCWKCSGTGRARNGELCERRGKERGS